MWYTAFGTQLAIGFASSQDGTHWTKHGEPVLAAGPSGSWDEGGVESPSVVWNGTTFLMYYDGSNGTVTSDVGVAFSKDMIHWQKYAGNPVLRHTPGTYDGFYLRYPDVIYDPPVYRMWYSARQAATPDNWTIAYATSPDGIHWIKYAGNPVVTANSSGRDGFYIQAKYPQVVKVGSIYLMVLDFADGADILSYATSSDGARWTSSGAPLIYRTPPTPQWDSIPYYPSPVLNGSELFLYYSGYDENITTSSIGLAYCSLIALPSTTTTVSTSTVTKTETSASTSTVVSRSTIVQTVTTTEEVQTPALPLYQVSTAVLAILLVTTVAIVFARRRPT